MKSLDLDLYQNRIGSQVRELRKERHWTQSKLAALLGLSQNRLSEIEHGKGSFTAEQLFVLLKTFNVAIDFFLPRRASKRSDLRNALSRFGASHLQEGESSVPSERYRDLNEVVLQTLLEGDSARDIAALAPVIVRNIRVLNIRKLRSRLREHDRERRLGWVLDSTLDAVHRELNGPVLKGEARINYRRTVRGLEQPLAWWKNEVFVPERSEDILDDVASERSIEEIKELRSDTAAEWNIVTRIQVDDFVVALREARGEV